MEESDFDRMIKKLVSICQIDINAKRVLTRIDPGNTKKIHYSQALSYFASYYMEDEEEDQ